MNPVTARVRELPWTPWFAHRPSIFGSFLSIYCISHISQECQIRLVSVITIFFGLDAIWKERINWVLLSYLAMGVFEKLFN